MADDEASQQRSRLAPPPTAGVATTFRAPPPAAAGSRFGFGSSAPRAATATTTASTTAARATTLSTARTSTFSSSAFGRPTFAPKTTTTTTATSMPRPSSAEGVSSRLRQKPAAAAASASAPKQATATSDLFATLASDVPPRSASGGSLPFAMGAASSSSSTAFASSYAARAVASKPAGQLFSMDDSDLGGDDGWGVVSPSNILSPASATDEKTTAAGASKPFDDEDEFGWTDETPVTSAPPPPVPTAVATPFAPEPTPASQAPPTELKFEEPASAPAVAASSTGWGDEFAYNADVNEAPADEIRWNDEDEWGTSAPKANGAASPAIEAVAGVPKTPVEPVATPVYVQAPPLSTASADLGAILSPSGPAGEFWGDEGDDVLFSDEEHPGPALEETPAPILKVEGLSLDAEPTHEEPTHEEHKHEESALEEPVSFQAAANEFSYQETEINGAVAEAVVESSEWDDEGDWGDQLRLSEVDGDIPFSTQAHAESTSEQHVEELHHFDSPAPEGHVSTVSSEVALEAEIAQTISALDTSEHTAEGTTSASVDDRAYSSHNNESFEAHATNDATVHTTYFDEHAHHSQNEAPAQASEQQTGIYGYGDNSSYSYESHAEDIEGRKQHFGQHEGGEHHGHHVAENGGFVEEQLQETYVKETANTTVNASGDREHGEHTHETFQRQVSWETHDEEFDASVSKAAAVEDNQGQSSSIPTSASSGKAEVSFGTSSFAAAELTYGHYHHDHHRTPSEAEVGSVASFAEASSAGATFGGSDHVSDGTYSDGDYASETRSVFGNSSAHSTAFITEPASSSDGQASNEDNGTYDHQSDMSSTVGGGGGAPSSEFDVSSTRSALFENEVASTGFEQGDDAYDYGEHSHHNHFEGSYDNEYNHRISESTTEFTEEARSAFDHTHDSEFSNSGFGAPPTAQQSPSPMYSRSSTPATYGVSSSQDLPTASDLEFDHSDSDNMFANSSSQQDSVPFGESSGDEVGLEAPKLAVTSAPVANVSGPFESDAIADDANPFASSGTGFPSPPAPPSFAPPPSDTSAYGASNSVDEALPSADSLFGASPAKNSPFGSFAASPAPPSHPVVYEEAPVSDAGSLFADAPSAPAFGGYEQPTPASASNFFGGGQGTPHNYEYDNAPPQYGYETASHPPAADAFAGSNQSHVFEANTCAYKESFQSASETFGGHVQSNEFNRDYGYDTQSHHSAAEAFGGSANGGFGGHNDSGFDGFGGSSGDTVSADSFFGGGSSAPTSAEDMFGSRSAMANEDQHSFGYHHGGEEHPSVDDSRPTVVEESVPTQVDDPTDIVNNSGTALEAPEALSSDSKEVRQNAEFHQEHYQPEGQWAYDAQTETQSFDGQQASHTTAEADMSTTDGHLGGPPSADQDYPSFGGTHDVDSFFGRSASAPPHDMYPATKSPSADKRFASFPPRSNGSPPRAPEASWTNQNTESTAAPRNEQPISQPSDIGHSFGETSAPLENQSLDEGAEDHFAGEGSCAASPFEQTAESEQQSDSSAFFGGNSTSDAFDGASQFDQTANSTQATDSSTYFGAESTGGGFGEYPPYEQNAELTQEADPSAFFGSQDSSNAFGASTDNGASGFFSGGPSQHHHGGGVYAQPPHDSSSPAYQSYEQASYGHQQDTYAGYENHAGGYATGHDYAYGDHNQSSSTGAHQTGQQSSSVGYSSTALHDYRSPTAAGFAHLVSTQSTSAFDYHSSTEAAQHPHNDASYHTPTLQPRPEPSTPKMDPSPLHGAKAHTNYNQFAAPAPTAAFGSAYESKPAFAQAAGSVDALTSNKHKDPNMVAPSCLASFGFGGNVVTMFPKQKLRLNASFATRNSPRTPQSMQFDNAPQGELRKGPVGVYRMENVHPRNTDFEELDKFPGPLNDSVTEEAILQYVEEKMSSASGSTHQDEDERLLLGILRVLIKCNGRLRSDANSNPSDPSSPEVQLVSLLKESDQRRRRNHPSNFPPPKPVQYATHPDAMLRNASRVRELLLLGDRKAAVDVAIQAQMWPEAMLIGSFTDKDEYKRVLCAYFTSHYAPGDPCRALYLSFADQQERSVHEPQKLMQHNKDENSSEILSTWVVHVQMLLANRTADTNKILVELGDRLWKEANAVVAAHVCYLLAGNTVEAPSPSSKIALLGADHRSPDEARFYVSPSAVQRTEIYEWVQKRINPAATNMIPFQGYKLIYAMILADHGKLETAFKYVNSMLTVIRAITATMKPGTSMYLEGMQNQLIVLDDRLRQHLGQDRADSVAAAASAKQGKQWGLGSALSIMGKIVNRVVEGNDTPQQAAAPRSTNGSLFPGAPRSNNNNVNAPPEYPSGAAVGYSSQSGPSMVPSAPGSGRSGGIYASHPAPHNPASAPQPVVATPSAHVPPTVQAPSVPAAFNVPRQLSGRSSAPPHQPMSDFSAPSSGSGGNAYPAPLSGGNGFNAPPPHMPQPPPSFPQNSFNQPPVAEAPPPFQRPTLDLSGNAGKSSYGNEAAQTDTSTPKSPPQSPRRGSGAPGSDKGSASPKVKEVPKKGGRSKTPPPSRSSSSGWLSGISTFIAAKMNPDAKVAKLGEHMDAYFDEEKKRWVFPGETQTDEPTMPSAPPTGPLPGSTPGSSSGGPLGGPPGAHSAPGSMAGGAAVNDPLAALMAPPPARALMKKDPLAAMMAPPPNRAAFGQRSATMPAKRPPPRPQFAVFKPAPGSQASSAPSEQGPPSSSGEPPAPPQ